jgi:hypothetical protein
MKKLTGAIILACVLSLSLLALFAIQPINAEQTPSTQPIDVKTGVWIINVQKVDLAASTYRLDFYLWFNFDPAQINSSEVGRFEFVNAQPTVKLVDSTESYLEYRVTGDFIKSFDFSMYPFESHDLTIELEHSNLDSNQLVYGIDNSSQVESAASIAGWNIGKLQFTTVEHSYGDQTFSRPVFTLTLSRPMTSAVIKSVLPITVITAISLLAFVMVAEDFAQKLALGITTLLSATAFHLSLISGIPPTGYLTFADRIMIAVYILFLFNIGSSVYLMRLARANKKDQAMAYNKKAQRLLPIMITILAILTIVI